MVFLSLIGSALNPKSHSPLSSIWCPVHRIGVDTRVTGPYPLLLLVSFHRKIRKMRLVSALGKKNALIIPACFGEFCCNIDG